MTPGIADGHEKGALGDDEEPAVPWAMTPDRVGRGVPNASAPHAYYDGWADWYEELLRDPLYAEVPEHVVRLAGSGNGICVDACCGTGAHLEALASQGWSVVGVDLSGDQLRLAAERWPRVVQGDATRMPFSGTSVSRVVSVLALTDLDDVAPFFDETRRILQSEGKLVLLATHPCFVTPFTKLEGDPEDAVRIYPGYGNTERAFEGPGVGDGLRSRVGVRHVPLAELLNKLVASDLAVEHAEELGDGTVPWLLALVATKSSV